MLVNQQPHWEAAHTCDGNKTKWLRINCSNVSPLNKLKLENMLQNLKAGIQKNLFSIYCTPHVQLLNHRLQFSEMPVFESCVLCAPSVLASIPATASQLDIKVKWKFLCALGDPSVIMTSYLSCNKESQPHIYQWSCSWRKQEPFKPSSALRCHWTLPSAALTPFVNNLQCIA